MRTHTDGRTEGVSIYTVPGRFLPAPRVEHVWLDALNLAPAEAGTSVGLVPRAPGLPGDWEPPSTVPMSQIGLRPHLPLGKRTSCAGRATDMSHTEHHRAGRGVDPCALAVA